MDDLSNSSNSNYHANTDSSNINMDNVSQTNDTDATTNVLNRNNVTVRDHLFQAMFSRIALTYDRTFPPFARRFIEFMLLLTAISVLFILIYIHMAFVKAPITCLDNFSFNDSNPNSPDGSAKHMVIRVEVLSNPPPKYGLYNSYAKEYDDLNHIDDLSNVDSGGKILSSARFSQMALFLNIISKQCHTNETRHIHTDDAHDQAAREQSQIDNTIIDRDKRKETEGFFARLFDFPINPILEKAEYWREKLSVRAMAPFRQTFNELELFAKSVFTEEKYIMEYSLEYGLLRLTPHTRERLNIPVHFVLLDSSKDQCFGNGLSRFLLQEFVGYDQIIIGSLKRLAERQNGKGYVRNVVSGEHYRFVNSWMSRTSYLAAGFIMIIFTLSVSMLLRYSHHQIFVFIVDLLRMLENNLQFSFPAAPLLTVVLALVGMEAIMSEFFNDTSTAFYTILIIWLADQYEAVCCRTYVSKRHWPKYFYLYHFAFYAYHYRFNGQFSGLALLCSWLFIQHSMFFFFHHYELPRLMHGIAVRAIMDSLVVDRADSNGSLTQPMFPNDDNDRDRSDGDRYDPDGGSGLSNLPSISRPSGEPHDGSHNGRSCPNNQSRNHSNHHSHSHSTNHTHMSSSGPQQLKCVWVSSTDRSTCMATVVVLVAREICFAIITYIAGIRYHSIESGPLTDQELSIARQWSLPTVPNIINHTSSPSQDDNDTNQSLDHPINPSCFHSIASTQILPLNRSGIDYVTDINPCCFHSSNDALKNLRPVLSRTDSHSILKDFGSIDNELPNVPQRSQSIQPSSSINADSILMF